MFFSHHQSSAYEPRHRILMIKNTYIITKQKCTAKFYFVIVLLKVILLKLHWSRQQCYKESIHKDFPLIINIPFLLLNCRHGHFYTSIAWNINFPFKEASILYPTLPLSFYSILPIFKKKWGGRCCLKCIKKLFPAFLIKQKILAYSNGNKMYVGIPGREDIIPPLLQHTYSFFHVCN